MRNFRSALIKRLHESGFSVCAYSPHDRYVPELIDLGAGHSDLTIANASTNPLTELRTIYRMARDLRRIRPSVLLTYTPKVNIYGALAAAMLRIPVIANISGLGRAFTYGGWVEYASRALYRLALRHPQVVFFQNEQDKHDFVAARLVEPNKCIRLPGSGVDLARFSPRKKKRESDIFVFLLASRLLWDKGVGTFIDAARIVKANASRVHFRLVGFLDVDNPSAVSRHHIDRWQSDGIVEYCGVTDNISEQYENADCFVLPSFYREGVPRSLLEAASMELPIITTDMPGCRDAVQDGVTGLLCRPKNADDLASAMLKILKMSPEDRQTMGHAAREKMRHEFDERIVLDAYMEAVTQVLVAGSA